MRRLYITDTRYLIMEKHKQIVLVIFDGWGYREETKGNAIAAANKPCFDGLWKSSPHAFLEASGRHAGLPDGEMGNSEVGHLSIGAGAAIDTDVVRISKAFATGTAQDIPAFAQLFEHVKKNNSTLHLMGLVSPGGIHSHQEHLYGLLRLAKAVGITKVVIHAFTDGRDTPPTSGIEHVGKLELFLKELGIGTIGTLSGRYFAMDRDNNWDRVEKVVNTLFNGQGDTHHKTPVEALAHYHAQNISDEHVPVHRFSDEAKIQKNDGVLFFNFRADRARMLAKKIEERMVEMNLCFVIMTQYHKNSAGLVAFPQIKVATTLASEIAASGRSQAHIAETEKYAHVTYFLNGGIEAPHSKEEFVLIDSRRDIATHDLAPEMKAKEITDKAIEYVEKGTDFVVLNYANPDMLGHTANLKATITAVETVDGQLARLVQATQKRGATMVITADHGNAEMVQDPHTGSPHTAHTNNPVPVIVVGAPGSLSNGSLADVAPTILELFGLKVPASMTGKSLLRYYE